MEGLATCPVTWNDAAHDMMEAAPSFEEFFERERDRLFRALCVITGNRHEAEDLSQEAFARVWERWPLVGEMDNPAGYLHRTALNLFRSRYRRAVLATRRGLRIAPEENAYEAVDDRQVILQALGTLPARQRAAIVLTESLRYTAQEAGSILGIRASTVRALCFQARSALKIAQEGPDG